MGQKLILTVQSYVTKYTQGLQTLCYFFFLWRLGVLRLGTLTIRYQIGTAMLGFEPFDVRCNVCLTCPKISKCHRKTFNLLSKQR